MALKHSAQPLPPPAASSEETDSGSGSEESEEEEEIAHSPPPTAPKMTATDLLQLKGQESEGSEEEEDDEEEEEEEEDEEEEEKVNLVPPPLTTKNSSPPPNREESETFDNEGEEEEETDDEAPERKPAPIQEAEEKGAKQPSSGEDNNPAAPFQRIWSTGDEVRILEAMAAHRRDHGTLPQVDALAAVLAGSLDNSGCSLKALLSKITSLKRLYNTASKKGELPSKDHDRRIFDLSKCVWGSVMAVAAASGGARRDFDEMCELYPYLAEEVKALQRAHNGLFKREFEMMDGGKARLLDEKIKKQRMHQLKVHNRRHDLTKEVTKTLIDLVD
ncbi:hypothetical protein HU200_009671 [Digitaria exilis]|uniref:Glabrous enhancer-binding protein-like DBD domain-containing protein n=1 Tax=Digitaria exilis TaxID=1010633 RepID=A0A835FJE0_9POAL|nr:hypothetical protein HU200_009671 [Digitaria exilis]CAB3476617.1 unnamed protein product [Digitaria exilis]